MTIIVNDGMSRHVFGIDTVSVHNNLTFCKINGSPKLFPILMDLVKRKIIYSFEPKGDVTSVTFHTKYVEEIL
jgi:hypothetical protein